MAGGHASPLKIYYVGAKHTAMVCHLPPAAEWQLPGGTCQRQFGRVLPRTLITGRLSLLISIMGRKLNLLLVPRAGLAVEVDRDADLRLGRLALDDCCPCCHLFLSAGMNLLVCGGKLQLVAITVAA